MDAEIQSFNPTAYGFWLKYFTAYTNSVVRRIDECALGMCAERNALSSMLTHGENEVDKVVSVYEDGKVIPSCGACCEFMMQLGNDAGNIEILLNNEGRTIKLIDLLPEYPKYK